jgi:hypothetical protein
MQACALVIAARSGAGVQTVTGVVDRDGAPFAGKAFVFQGNGILNTIEGAGRHFNGFDDGVSVRRSDGFEDANFAGFKGCSGGSSGDYSVLSMHMQSQFGGATYRLAYVSAVRVGEFDLTYDTNTLTGDSFVALILGGNDLDVTVGNVSATSPGNTITPGFAPVAAIFKSQLLTTGTAIASGGGGAGWGWAIDDDTQMAIATRDHDLAGNDRLQLTDRAQTSGTASRLATFASNHYSLSIGGGAASCGHLTVGGVSRATGSFSRSSTGTEVVTCGIDAKAILLIGVAVPSGAGALTDRMSLSFGIATHTGAQAAYWTGQQNVGTPFPGGPPLGGRYLSNADLLIAGTPNGVGTTVDVKARLSAVDSVNGTFSLNFLLNDGVTREWLWLALGDPVQPAGGGGGGGGGSTCAVDIEAAGCWSGPGAPPSAACITPPNGAAGCWGSQPSGPPAAEMEP